MPPHLHPRSRMTSSLFATTVVASFFVVALPHILPCPVPRTKFADGEVIVDENGRRRRWRRRETTESKDGIVQFNQTAEDDTYTNAGRATRECPVPKPGGILGEWLGFHKGDDEPGKR
ncbi:F-box domain-containing protein [Purpureocillium lavendulum]|uniref:F-box domain-containing protein n=1 Tax=Purpureocillium lavendulum TaxID=1247861 RepID=A0AB34G0L1_9HYPO|nr:F-box domain-containing protein [Purpureocillium lavendulum]